jgi:hypothetical protein
VSSIKFIRLKGTLKPQIKNKGFCPASILSTPKYIHFHSLLSPCIFYLINIKAGGDVRTVREHGLGQGIIGMS